MITFREVEVCAVKKRYRDEGTPEAVLQARADVASQLRSARAEKQLTQQMVADRAGTSKSDISRLESGRYNPSLDFLVKVAGTMGKEVSVRIE